MLRPDRQEVTRAVRLSTLVCVPAVASFVYCLTFVHGAVGAVAGHRTDLAQLGLRTTLTAGPRRAAIMAVGLTRGAGCWNQRVFVREASPSGRASRK